MKTINVELTERQVMLLKYLARDKAQKTNNDELFDEYWEIYSILRKSKKEEKEVKEDK